MSLSYKNPAFCILTLPPPITLITSITPTICKTSSPQIDVDKMSYNQPQPNAVGNLPFTCSTCKISFERQRAAARSTPQRLAVSSTMVGLNARIKKEPSRYNLHLKTAASPPITFVEFNGNGRAPMTDNEPSAIASLEKLSVNAQAPDL